jgi:hypothetical protein
VAQPSHCRTGRPTQVKDSAKNDPILREVGAPTTRLDELGIENELLRWFHYERSAIEFKPTVVFHNLPKADDS